MASVFFAIYDDSAAPVPFKMMHKNPVTIYRTANMSLMEEISGMGFEPKAVLLEEDIESLMNGGYTNDDITTDEMKFLTETSSQWSWKGQ